MLVIESGMLTDVILVHCLNADVPMLVTEAGMLIDTRLVHCLNADVPMLVTEAWMLTEDRLVHRMNASAPMLVTEVGMLTDTKLVHRSKADISMLTNESGMVTWPRTSGSIVHPPKAPGSRAPSRASRAIRTTRGSAMAVPARWSDSESDQIRVHPPTAPQRRSLEEGGRLTCC
jgi:hypothetical protein